MYNFKNVENVERFLNEIGVNVELERMDAIKEGLVYSRNEFNELDEFLNFDELNKYANEQLEALINNDLDSEEVVDLVEEYTSMNYYEIVCCYYNQTQEQLEMYGEGGFTWYYKSRSLLSGKDVLKKALENCKGSVGYEELVNASKSFDYAIMISKQEFMESSGIEA